MALFKVTLLVMLAAVASRAEPQGQPYLPPKPGYEYTSPKIPFQTPTTPRPTGSIFTGTSRPTVFTGTSRPTVFTGTSRPTRPHPGTTQTNYNPSGSGNTESVYHGENDHLNHVHVPGKPYDFNYAVKDDFYGTDYSRNEVSNGDVITGEYRVLLPDGRLQIVRYTADWKTGYHADVSYEGQAQYPQATNQGPYQAPSGPAPAYGVPASGGNRGY